MASTELTSVSRRVGSYVPPTGALAASVASNRVEKLKLHAVALADQEKAAEMRRQEEEKKNKLWTAACVLVSSLASKSIFCFR